MKKLINSKLLLQVIVASMVATLATAGIVAAATTVGSNINTAGTLTTSGANTLYGATTVGGALTATTTFAVTGVTTLTGQLNFVNASSTGWIKSSSIKSDTGAISFDDDNLTTTGTVTATTFTGAFTGAVTGTSTRATNLAAGAANQIPYQTAYNTTAFAAAGTSGQLLVANGSAVPTFVTMGTDATISNAGALTIAANAVQGTDIALASEAAGDIMYNDGTDWVRLASSTDANIMIIDANGWPSWAAVSGDATIGATGVLTIGSGAVTAAKLQSAAADLGAANVTVDFGNTNGDFNTNITTDGSITATGGFVGNASTATAATSATSATTATNLAGGAANQIAYQTGAGATSFLTAGTDGQLLVANGSGVPTFVTMGTDATISNAGALTIAANAVQGTDISLASEAAGDIMYANGTDWIRLAKGTANQMLQINADETAPEWATFAASLGNTLAWTAAQLLDEGFSVDTTAFAVTGAGALSTTQAAALNGGLTVNTTQFTVNGTNGIVTIVPPATMTTGNLLTLSAAGALSATGAYNGISVDLTNVTGNSQAINGIYVNDVTAGAGAENGIYVVGTGWDYGLYVVDAVKFDGTVTITEGALTDSTIVSADIKDGEVASIDMTAGAKTHSVVVPVPDPGATDADIAAGYVLWKPSVAVTITKVYVVPETIYAGVDGSNTLVVAVSDAGGAVATLTSTTNLAAGSINDAGAITNASVAADGTVTIAVTAGTTADAPRQNIQIEYTTTN